MGESATRGARGDGDDASLAGVIGGVSSIACVDSGDVELDDGLQVRVTRIEGKVPVSFIKGVDVDSTRRSTTRVWMDLR